VESFLSGIECKWGYDDRQTEIQQRISNAWGQCLWGWDSYWKATNPQILINFQQNWLQQGVEQFTLRSIKIINYIWNREEVTVEWKESIIAPTYMKEHKTDCSNYRGTSLVSTTYKILPSILLSRLTPYAEETIGDRQCGFRCNRSTTDHIFYMANTWETKYEEAVYQLFYRLQGSMCFS